MERRGLVAYVEAQIERDIALGRLHPSGQFGSEAKLARRYEVCRGTIREALRRLAARGLVVQRPGRKTRAVPLDESLTLENLGLALHDASNPDARWLLEGYFSLKRQVLVELLADCCARASDLDLDRLGSTCYQLQDAARWESGETCAQAEFELLRHAARVAARPGHVLLVQSLQRAFLGGAAQLLPLMGGAALREWAFRAMAVLHERDVQALQHELPALLKARDERVLNAFAPAPQVPAAPVAPGSQSDVHGTPVSAIARDDALEARPCVQECRPGDSTQCSVQENALEARPLGEERDLGGVASAAGDIQVLGIAPCFPVEPDSGGSLSSDAGGLALLASRGECIETDLLEAALGNLSDCRTSCDNSSSDGGLQSEPPPTRAHGQADVAEREVGGAIHGHLRRWVARLLRSTAHSLGRLASSYRASGDLLRAAQCRERPTSLSPSLHPDAASRARAGPA
ncbi:FadR family transcriptional regulator [Corallococcus exiguus]|uniref:FadR/GntR family transcriptional regulator n=1 Tax=Corallococcus TaxID=83461 RepID=UPI000EBE70BF|nr:MULTISPECIES: GntR family transcriptional regulator [Corallococcus]NNC17395.1 FadR family transcriptional regulator [Corallococcus exiguus]RKI08215.1 FadR family transcriptional regulator [Corallococcus sp. AB030]RUO94026.1 FadR family transcriptional regulator [Corallococcus sp. AB018]